MNSATYPQPTLASLLFAAAIVWAISRFVAALNGRNDETKRIRGQFVPEWIGLLYVGFGLYGLYINPGPPSPYPLAMTLPPFALILGPIVGLIHGTYRLRCQTHVDSDHIHRNTQPDDGNPYRPS